jgi:CheY-like chemotaxis protein
VHRGGKVPAIALSAYTRIDDRMAAQDAGFNAFVAKPAAPSDLLATIGRLLGEPEPSSRA